MNKRIKIVSDTEVRIERLPLGAQFTTTLTIDADDKCCVRMTAPQRDATCWDAEGRAALRDCINCLEASGSFAALSDESAVPFVGKRMRWGHTLRAPDEITIAVIDDKFVGVQAPDPHEGCGWSMHNIPLANVLALTPAKPKVTAWTAETAYTKVPPNTHLIHKEDGRRYVVQRFESWSGSWKLELDPSWVVTPGFLAERFTIWDGTPCGVVE